MSFLGLRAGRQIGSIEKSQTNSAVLVTPIVNPKS